MVVAGKPAASLVSRHDPRPARRTAGLMAQGGPAGSIAPPYCLARRRVPGADAQPSRQPQKPGRPGEWVGEGWNGATALAYMSSSSHALGFGNRLTRINGSAPTVALR